MKKKIKSLENFLFDCHVFLTDKNDFKKKKKKRLV